MNAGDIYIKTKLDNSELESKDIPELEKKLGNVSKQGGSKLAGAFSKIGGIVSSIGSALLKIGGVIADIVLKATALGTALIGGTIGALILSKAFEEVFEKNEQIKANLDYMRWTIVQALQPAIQVVADILKQIVEWLIKALYYIGYIIKAWTGYDMFKNANVGAYEKSLKEGEKSTKKTANNIRAIKKQLAGFDEMNVLSDTRSQSAGGSGGTGGGKTPKLPDFDFSKLDFEIPEWIKWIADHGKEVIAIIGGILVALILLKAFMSGGLTGLAIAGIIIGLIEVFVQLWLIGEKVVDFLNDPSWENFIDILRQMFQFTGWYWLFRDQIEGFLDWLTKLPDNIKKDVIDPIADFVGGLLDTITSFLGGIWQGILDFIMPIVTYINDNLIQPIKENVKTLWNNLMIILGAIGNWINEKVIKPIKDTFKAVKEWFEKNIITPVKAWIDGILTKIKSFIKSAKEVFDGFKTFMQDKIIKPIVNKFTEIGKGVGTTIEKAFKGVINAFLGFAESFLNLPVKAINGLIDVIRKIPGLDRLETLKTFKFPRLAKGGIVNMPSRGVPVGGAIAGERGAEGVIPLTDSQQMALLGEAIGKYITINANITNTMNGRVISRELQKINNENDFAFNR